MPLIQLGQPAWDAPRAHRDGLARAELDGSSTDVLVLLDAQSHDLEQLMHAAAPATEVWFLICANIASALANADGDGYAATLLRAGMLANAITAAALASGWSVSTDFSPSYAATQTARQSDRQAMHICTVHASRRGGHSPLAKPARAIICTVG